MRRFILLLLTAVLIWLIAARGALPEPAVEAASLAASWDSAAYNVLDWDLSGRSQTAGSAYLAEMNSHFLACVPTARHSRTGLLAGRNLLLILADDWQPEGMSAAQAPALYGLWSGGVQFSDYYAPDWYQGREGREFALLTGLTPTAVQNRTSMALLAEQDISLPFALARCLAGMGYTCRAYGPEEQRAAYEALGFSSVSAAASLESDLPALAERAPFFAYLVLEEGDGEAALERALQALTYAGVRDATAVCAVVGSSDALRGGLFMQAPGLEGVSVPAPCSELDVTPTLLDLFGAAYDARFLSGRDVLADGAPGPELLVSLYGSAYSDWVTDAGSYLAAEDVFFPLDSRFTGPGETQAYVLKIRNTVYDRYVFSRRILEGNYFRLLTGQ